MNERLRRAITVGVITAVVGIITAVVGIIAFGTAQALLANHEERDSVDRFTSRRLP